MINPPQITDFEKVGSTRVIVRVFDASAQESHGLYKLVGSINIQSFIEVLSFENLLEANLRKPAPNRVTADILETLSTSPDMFLMRSKGLLLCVRGCKPKDRDRFELSISVPGLEGIVDGGHTSLAIGTYILQLVSDNENTKIKDWEEFTEMWNNWKSAINKERRLLIEDAEASKLRELANIRIPIEIIYPNLNEFLYADESLYFEALADIASARNQNAEVSAGAKANHLGYFNILKENLTKDIADRVEWRPNDGRGKDIKINDIVALASVPIVALQNEGFFENQILNPISLYSGKGAVLKVFAELIEKNSDRSGRDNLVLNSSELESAVKLVATMPRMYDAIYLMFPAAYLKFSQGWGRITEVKNVESNDPKKAKYSKYTKQKLKYKYPDGYIYPVLLSVTKLMKLVDGRLIWKMDDPVGYMESKLEECFCAAYCQGFAAASNDAQQLAKNRANYTTVEDALEIQLWKDGLMK